MYIYVSTLGYLELSLCVCVCVCGLWVGLLSVSHVPLFIHDRTRQSERCRDVKGSEERRLKKQEEKIGGKRGGHSKRMGYSFLLFALPVCGMLGKNTAVSTLSRLFCLPAGCFSGLLFKDQSILSAAGVCFSASPRLVWLGVMGASRSKCAHVFGGCIVTYQFAEARVLYSFHVSINDF